MERIVKNSVLSAIMGARGEGFVPAAVSNRHVHLDQAAADALFGAGYKFNKLKDLSQPGQYAFEEVVTIEGPKGRLKLRVLGPLRDNTQAELSVTDARGIGIVPVVRLSGELKGTPGATLEGPAGSIKLSSGVIVAARHLHISAEQAAIFGLKDKDVVRLLAGGERGAVLERVVVRAGSGHELELHIDFDEANCALINTGDILKIV